MTVPRPSVRSLRGKLILFSLVLVVVPGAVFALIAYASARAALQDAVGRLLAEVAHDTAAEVSELLVREGRTVRTWAHQEVMREVVIGDIDKRVSRFLASLKQSDSGYVELLCTDMSGRVVAASNPALVGLSQTDSDWFRAAVSGREFLSGPVRPSQDAPQVLEIAAPIHSPDAPGTVIGTFLGWYDWNRVVGVARAIQQNAEAIKLTIDVLLLDDAGVVIAESGGSRLGVLVGQNLREAGWVAAGRPAERSRPGFVREPKVVALVGYARVKWTRPHWTALVVEAPREALAPVYRMRNRLRLLLAGVLLSALGVAILLAERMSRPLRELTEATREIAHSGGVQHPVPVRSRDEIGQLAVAFNTMATDLKRAQDALVTAEKFAFIGEIAAGVAHEVRTPLGILRSSAQILGRSLPAGDSERAELVGMIVEEVDRLDRVVAGLLELARPREPLIEPTPLAGVLARALDFVDRQAQQQGITIRRELAAGQRPARCDPEQMYQVALNLLVNALQILPRGSELLVRTLPGGDGRVAFEISDNGPGIAAEFRDKVFTPFFTMREGGTGLGLALVQRVVQTHQGTVSVVSEVGQGTTFRVELPAAEER